MSVHSCLRVAPAALLVSVACAALGQPPAQPDPALGGFTPPPPHLNAPLGDIPRMPGNGEGAYATHHSRMRHHPVLTEMGPFPSDAQVPSGEQHYHDGMLDLMSMLQCSGNFQIIERQGAKESKGAK